MKLNNFIEITENQIIELLNSIEIRDIDYCLCDCRRQIDKSTSFEYSKYKESYIYRSGNEYRCDNCVKISMEKLGVDEYNQNTYSVNLLVMYNNIVVIEFTFDGYKYSSDSTAKKIYERLQIEIENFKNRLKKLKKDLEVPVNLLEHSSL